MESFTSSRSRKKSRISILLLFSVGLLAFTWLFSLSMRWFDSDMAFSRLWWHGPRAWFGDKSATCWLLNEFGPVPGVLLAGIALVVLLVSRFRVSMRHLSLPALYLVLSFLIGPGLLVNGVLKHSWSRARPKELKEFGRKSVYEPVLTHVEASQGRSFPSGHASAAFFLCSLGFASALWGSREGMWGGLLLGCGWGCLVAWSRVASGAHFLSDVMWSAALVNTVNFAALLPFLLGSLQRSEEDLLPSPQIRRLARHS